MSAIRLYLDEDSMAESLVQGLRARGVDVVTAFEAGMVGRSDEEQLRWAASHGRVLYSFNVSDFYRLHSDFVARGEVHAGIVLVQQRRYRVGDQLRGVLRLIAARSAEDMAQGVAFLGAWISSGPVGS